MRRSLLQLIPNQVGKQLAHVGHQMPKVSELKHVRAAEHRLASVVFNRHIEYPDVR